MDQRMQKLAYVLINYSLKLKKGEKVAIRGEDVALPLMTECYREAIKAGALPQIAVVHPPVSEILLKQGTDEQLAYVADSDMKLAESVDAGLFFWGTRNTRAQSNIDSDRIRARSKATFGINKIYHSREAEGKYRWCGTQYPTEANAQEANMSLAEYEDFVYGAGMIDSPDPIAHWEKIQKEQDRLCGILNGFKTIRYVSKDTDLSFGVGGRKWINCCGFVNFPDGEVFTGPVEDSAEGTIRFSFPGIYMGKEIEDIRLTFEKGKVVKASASKGEDLLHKLLDTDEGARRIGEVAVGTNFGIQQFTRNMLFDEKIGGTVHVALGFAIPASGGKNESAIHWDMLCDMRNGGEIHGDGKVIYRDGKFLI